MKNLACISVLQKDEALLTFLLDKQKEKSIVLMADKSITATIEAAEGNNIPLHLKNTHSIVDKKIS